MGLQVAAAGKIINEFTGLAFAGGEFETDNPAIRFVSAEAWTANAQGAHITFATAPIGTSSPVEGMRLTSEGILLVGTDTASGSAKLQVSGAISVSGITYGGTLALSATGANVITLSTNGSARVSVGSSGTTQVNGQLTVASSAAAAIAQRWTDSTNYTADLGYKASGQLYFGGNVGASLYLRADNTDYAAITTTYGLDVIKSGSSGTLRVYDQTATTGSTSLVVQAGAGQSTNALFNIVANDGTTSVFKALETKIGFFGATPVVKQTVTADAASILAALQAYGLAV